MARPYRVLLASASAGTGHLRAAEALRHAFVQDVHAEHVDVLDLGPGWLRRAYADGFELIAARAPRVWKEIYARTDGEIDAARWGAVAHELLFGAFKRLLESAAWDAVVCTHFLPCQLAAGRAGMPPFALVATDFTLHRYWVQRRVVRSFVATEALAAEMRHRLPGVRVHATGIPIAEQFTAPPSRDAARAGLGVGAAERVVLVMGGGLGIGVVGAARAASAATTPGLRIVAVAGRNERARRELEALSARDPRVRAYGFVDRIHEWMAAADVVLTKPGGLTISEALAMGRPLILTAGIPGHEEANARAMARFGVALQAPGESDTRAAVERVFGDSELLGRMSAAAAAVGRPWAAHDIAAVVRRALLLRRAA